MSAANERSQLSHRPDPCTKKRYRTGLKSNNPAIYEPCLLWTLTKKSKAATLFSYVAIIKNLVKFLPAYRTMGT